MARTAHSESEWRGVSNEIGWAGGVRQGERTLAARQGGLQSSPRQPVGVVDQVARLLVDLLADLLGNLQRRASAAMVRLQEREPFGLILARFVVVEVLECAHRYAELRRADQLVVLGTRGLNLSANLRARR
jgi:hypothetical protein